MLQHQFQADTFKNWLRSKLQSNAPVSLDEFVAGQKLWKAIGYGKKQNAQRQLAGHPQAVRTGTKAPAVPFGEWSEDGTVSRDAQGEFTANPCYLTNKGFKLLLQVAPGQEGQAWRLYLVEVEQYLSRMLSENSRKELADHHGQATASLFEAEFSVEDVTAIRGEGFCKLHGQSILTTKQQIKDQKGLKGQAKNVNQYNHADDETMKLHRLYNAQLEYLAEPGLTAKEVTSAAVGKMFENARFKEGLTGTAILAPAKSGRMVIPFKIRSGPAVRPGDSEKRKLKAKKEKAELKKAEQQLTIGC
jgi:hypothetical protein